MKLISILTISFVFLVTACSPSIPAPTGTPTASLIPTDTATPTSTLTPTEAFTLTSTPSPTADTRPLPRSWSSWPIIPSVSPRAVEINRTGLLLGVSPDTFSVAGDCQSEPEVFMGIYATERNPIGENSPQLLETISAFQDSFLHDSVAVRDGLSAPSVLDPLWSDPTQCESTESPLACELRLYKPMIMFVNLGTNWRADASAEAYEGYLRQIVEQIIAAGTVPILTNKADNVEGDHAINRVTAQVAYDYDIPYMNFWLRTDSMSNHGLDADRTPANVYLTPTGWDARNFTALSTLDSIWRGLTSAP